MPNPLEQRTRAREQAPPSVAAALLGSSRLAALGLTLVAAAWCGCSGDGALDGGPARDLGGARDASVASDAAPPDAGGQADAGSADAGADASPSDLGAVDAGTLGGGFAEVVTRAMYDQFFLHRADPACEGGLFSYDALVAAAATFPDFCNEGSLEVRRREAAAFLANVSHETTGGWATAPDGPYAWGLCFKEEVGCGGGACTGYCSPSVTWPCASGQTYHGRGPMQLSWNYNYGQAGDALGLDLLNQPNLVTSDGTVAFRTAIWFWMTAQAPKPSCHDVMVGSWTPTAADTSQNRAPGFGMTVNIINGGLECNIGSDYRVNDRIGFYQRYTALLGVAPGDHLDCETMGSY